MKGSTDESRNPYNCSAPLFLALALLCVFFFLNIGALYNLSLYAPFAYNPTYDESILHDAPHSKRFVLEGAIDINSAGVEEISLMPGIGGNLARRIMEKREEMGGFASIEELKGVKGIGEAKLNAIRRYIVIGRAEKREAKVGERYP